MPPAIEAAALFAGGGEMGALMRSKNWAETPVGSLDRWPQSLRTAISILLESKFGMMIAWGPELTHFYNDAYRPILGSTKHPSLGWRVPDVFPEIWATIGPLFAGVMEGRAVGFEDLLVPLERHGFLEDCWFTFSYSPIREESGAVGGVLVTVAETTARVLAERRLRLLRELAAVASSARDKAETWAATAAVLAAGKDDFASALLYELQPDGRRATLAVDSGRADAPKEIDLRAPPSWPERTLALPLRRAVESEPYGYLVARASERLAFEEAYHQFFSLAADQIATAIANANAFQEAQQRADALATIDRAKTVFLSNVSHEFRTPLTLILGPTDELLTGQHGDLSAAQRAQLEILRRNGLRLYRLVNALLEFSRVEAGRAQASYEPLDLGLLTRDVASSFQSAISRAGLELIVRCPPLDQPIFVDPQMWEQILLNLLSNALKFTFEGSITVSIEGTPEHAILRVADTGVGIRAEDQPKLFERFHRIEGTPARTREGSGIGLALVQELVRLHGGSISMSSTFGAGTTFEVKIPTGSSHLPQDRIGKAAPRSESTSASFVEEALRWLPDAAPPSAEKRPGAPRVLVADDSADMRDYVRRVLADHWSVETVPDGAAALRAVAENPPDVIVSDVMMPGIDGIRLVSTLKARSETARIPVLLLSARAGEDARIEALTAGADDYLLKPFSARELLAKVAAHAGAARANSVLAAERARLYAVFQNAPALICVLHGPDHVFELANPLYLRLIGNRPVLGRKLREALPEIEGQGYFELVDEVYETGEPRYGNEARVLLDSRGTGELEERYVSFIYYPDRNRRGQVEDILVFGFDVTDQVVTRRKVEDDRRSAEAAQRRAEAAVQARDQFFSMASHELRTPLTTLGLQIDSLLKVLSDAEPTDGLIDHCLPKAKRIRAQTDRLEQLLDSMLDVFSSAKLSTAAREELDLAQHARHAIEKLSPQSRSLIRFSGEPATGLWHRSYIDQIIQHLLSNAIKFGKSSPIVVRVEPRGDQARLLVADGGIGIAPQDQQRIFDRFERAAPVEHYSGLGLGLWAVREMTKALGGTIRVESEAERGATFIVDLPRRL